MAFEIELEDIEPFLTRPLKTSQVDRVEAWLPVLTLHLVARYGDQITTALEPAFFSAAADAVENRLSRPGNVLQQAAGPASVRYNDKAALLRWFSPDQLDELDGLLNLGGMRSIRTPAPDGQRYGNLMHRYPFDTVDESGESDYEWGGS